MSDFTHDTADDGFHEIQLSGKQLVFLFIVTTTVIVVVFLCGVKVGRGARAAQGEEPERAGVAATAAPAAQSASDPGATAAEPPTPVDETPAALKYPDLLAEGSSPDPRLKPPADNALPAETAPAPTPRPAPAVEAPRPAPAAEVGVPGAGRDGTWAVQVIATRDRNIATSIVKRLVGKDYPAFLVNPPKGSGPAFYKVHVGRFNDRGEAEQVSQRIKKEEQFQSWITR